MYAICSRWMCSFSVQLNQTLFGSSIKNTVARVGDRIGAYRVSVGKPEGKRSLERPRRKWKDNNKTNLQEVGWEGIDWIDLASYKWHYDCLTCHWNCTQEMFRCPSMHAISSDVRVPVQVAVRVIPHWDDICHDIMGKKANRTQTHACNNKINIVSHQNKSFFHTSAFITS